MNKEEALDILISEIRQSRTPPPNAIRIKDLIDSGLSERTARKKFFEKVKAGWKLEEYIVGSSKTRFIIPPE